MNQMDILNGKTVLVTGGTGSFGMAFTKAVLNNSKIKKLRIFSRDEFKQYQMEREFSDNRIRFLIGDIRDKERLMRAFSGVDFVVHAAALKQVPTLEFNPFEAIKTNIIGTQNVIDAAIDCGVKKAILISSDKAVQPVNLYGATKLCAEKIFVSGNFYSATKTIFGVVRYGNVVGSRGGVVEALAQQKATGVVALTDKRMTRFWITLNEGVNLVLTALKLTKGGEIFIPKIPSMRIKDLISCLAPGCKIKVIGIRPGEKLHEALMTEEESSNALELNNNYIIKPKIDWWDDKHLLGAKRVKPSFFYSSQNNKKWLKPRELSKMVKSV